ncbi:MAG: hypothetical protein QNJ30_12390 [Kiloniellales bacterium]|nr:hypothetical protein [Kiloniellales bacterium]
MRRRFGLISLVLAAACAAAPGPAAAAACRPVSQVGAYRFELCAAAEGPGQRLRLLRDGTEVFATEDRRIEVAPALLAAGGGRDPLPPGWDVTGDGQPDAVVYGDSGGAHCCIQVYVLRLGPDFAVLNRLDAGKHLPLFRQADGDPALEIELRDNIFAYWRAPFARSPAPRVVLDFRDGRYQAAPELMRQPALGEARLQRRAQALRRGEGWDRDPRYPLDSGLWTVMLELVYGGNLTQAERFLELAWPESRPGREDFRRAFFDCQLRFSLYWPAVAALNGLKPLPPAEGCSG